MVLESSREPLSKRSRICNGWAWIGTPDPPCKPRMRRSTETLWTAWPSESLIYPCYCTRSQIQAASHSAPQEGAQELHYPGTCRPETEQASAIRDKVVRATRWLQPGEAGWRIVVPGGEFSIVDQVAGVVRQNVQSHVGDFLVATKTGWPSYQLAVVVDDHQQQVTDVVRGDDLLDSTPRQAYLHRCLSLPEPRYWHLPIVVGEDGRRLAKRHGDTRLSHYRELGVPPERIVALLGDWCGLGRQSALSAQEFRARFDWRRMPRERITMTAADDAWLRGG